MTVVSATPQRSLITPPVPIAGRCNAKLRGPRAGRLCPNYPVTGRARCRLHGGATPRGAASVHYKHGRDSRAVQDAQRFDRDVTRVRTWALTTAAALPPGRLRDRLETLAGEIGDQP
jgi:hypothetical protein